MRCIPGIPPRPVGGLLFDTRHPKANSQKPTSNSQKPKAPRLRDQYPFLAAPDCPPELKILAANKLTAYHTYVAAHKRLFDCTTLDQQFDTVQQLVESFIDNRAIFDEFQYYKQHGTVLGQHPVFAEYQQIRTLRGLSDIELYKTKKNLEHNIWRIQHQLATDPKPHLTITRQASLQTKRNQLAEINRLLPPTSH